MKVGDTQLAVGVTGETNIFQDGALISSTSTVPSSCSEWLKYYSSTLEACTCDLSAVSPSTTGADYSSCAGATSGDTCVPTCLGGCLRSYSRASTAPNGSRLPRNLRFKRL